MGPAAAIGAFFIEGFAEAFIEYLFAPLVRGGFDLLEALAAALGELVETVFALVDRVTQ